MSDYSNLDYMEHLTLGKVHYTNKKTRDKVILLECTINGTNITYAFDNRPKMENFLKQLRNSMIDKGYSLDYSITEKTIEGGRVSH